MDYRRLGRSGLKVSELSFGSWVTFAKDLDLAGVKKCIRLAFERGVNFFDNAEAYANGMSEILMGKAIKEYRREDLVISTKIFWGGNGPNDTGLSWKRLMEGTKNSLKRLQLEYVDLLFCHRPDETTPIEETVRAMDVLIRSGRVFYWGTSEWSAQQIEEAHRIAKEIGAIPPVMEQPEYNLFNRSKVEEEFLPLYDKYGMGTTIWSPLDSGILTGKYAKGIPEGSRFGKHPELSGRLTQEKLDQVNELASLARELNCTLAQLSIAWCLKNPHVSTVITGAANADQLGENMEAIHVKHLLDEGVMQKIQTIIGGKRWEGILQKS
ncbi:MAG: aldo/keto reductase [Waddliaceae bacterium]